MARKKVRKKSSRKTSRSKAVGKTKSGLPTNWKEQMREDAQEESERTPTGSGNKINLKRNNQFSFQGADLGNSIDVVIVDHVVMKTWYEGEFDEDNPTPPNCFALKPSAKNIAPHTDSPDKQDETCEECWANQWKTGRGGKGKACKDKNRLAVLHADDLDGELAMIEVPVTSGAAFNKYVKGITEAVDLPSYAVVTRITMDEHADWQTLIFEMAETIPDKLMAGPFSRRKQAREALMEPFDVSGFEKSGGRKKASKKKVSKKKVAKKKRRSRMS